MEEPLEPPAYAAEEKLHLHKERVRAFGRRDNDLTEAIRDLAEDDTLKRSMCMVAFLEEIIDKHGLTV